MLGRGVGQPLDVRTEAGLAREVDGGVDPKPRGALLRHRVDQPAEGRLSGQRIVVSLGVAEDVNRASDQIASINQHPISTGGRWSTPHPACGVV